MRARNGGSRWVSRALARKATVVAAAATFAGVVPTAAQAELVFAANGGSNTISAFSVGGGGQLTPVACSPASNCDTGGHPAGLAVDPTGKFLYAANSDYVPGSHGDTMSEFSISSTGVLTPLCNPLVNCPATGNEPGALAVDPAGPYLYAGDVQFGRISPFTIGSSGALAPIACVAFGCEISGGGGPSGVAVSGSFLYGGGSPISIFPIGSGGALTSTTCTTQTNCEIPAGNTAFDIAVDPSGPWLLVASQDTHGGGDLSVFKIGSDGSLTPIACTDTVTTGCIDQGSTAIAVDPAGPYVYTVNEFGGDGVSGYSISASGTLTPITCTPATSCQAGVGPDALAVDPSGHYLFAANAGNIGNGSVSVFAIGPGGTLTPVACTPTTSATGCAAGMALDGIAVDPNGGAPTGPTGPGSTAATLSSLTVSPASFNRSGRKVHGRCVAATARTRSHRKCTRPIALTLAYTLSGASKVELTVVLDATGRRVSGQCVAASKHNRRDPKCSRSVPLSGAVTLTGKAGRNTDRFNGVLRSHSLAAGSYTLALTPAGGRAVTRRFTIVG